MQEITIFLWNILMSHCFASMVFSHSIFLILACTKVRIMLKYSYGYKYFGYFHQKSVYAGIPPLLQVAHI